MNRVELININGVAFHVDGDAYDKLSKYLDTLGKYFKEEPGGNEIIADIEARIAELFSEQMTQSNQVVSIDDVQRVIETLGTPEDIAGTDSEPDTPKASAQNQSNAQKTKRLYRDPDRQLLGGVCSGIAAWLDINPVIVRLVFLLVTFFFGTAVIIYAILWIIMPQAKTTAQKLEMRGEPVTVSNIEKKVKKEISASDSLGQSFRQFLNEAGELIAKLFSVLGRIILFIVGLISFLLGLNLCLGIGGVFLVKSWIFRHAFDRDLYSFQELLQHIVSPVSYNILWICIVVVAVLTVVGLMFWGLKLMTGFKVKQKLAHIVLAIVWLAAILVGIVTTIREAGNYAWNNEFSETITIAPTDTLYLSTKQPDIKFFGNPTELYLIDQVTGNLYGKPNLRIRKSEDGQIKLSVRKRAQGTSTSDAYGYAEKITYTVENRDSLLVMAPYFSVEPYDRWHFQTLNVDLFVPVGTVIVFDKEAFQQNRIGHRYYCHGNGPCVWVMTEDRGLQFADQQLSTQQKHEVKKPEDQAQSEIESQ